MEKDKQVGTDVIEIAGVVDEEKAIEEGVEYIISRLRERTQGRVQVIASVLDLSSKPKRDGNYMQHNSTCP